MSKSQLKSHDKLFEKSSRTKALLKMIRDLMSLIWKRSIRWDLKSSNLVKRKMGMRLLKSQLPCLRCLNQSQKSKTFSIWIQRSQISAKILLLKLSIFPETLMHFKKRSHKDIQCLKFSKNLKTIENRIHQSSHLKISSQTHLSLQESPKIKIS